MPPQLGDEGVKGLRSHEQPCQRSLQCGAMRDLGGAEREEEVAIVGRQGPLCSSI